MKKERGFALLDVMISGTIIATFTAIMLVQLGAAQNMSGIAGRDLAASRIVAEKLEAARGRGALLSCANAGTVTTQEQRGSRPYTVRVVTSGRITDEQDVGTTRINTVFCEVEVKVEFRASDNPRTVKAKTRLYL